jgi:hypothetical protein
MGEAQWLLHGTVVLGFNVSAVVKIGTSLDPDEVANLRYINTHVRTSRHRRHWAA